MKKILYNKNVNENAFTLIKLLYLYSDYCKFDKETTEKIKKFILFLEKKYKLDYSGLNTDVENETLQLILSCSESEK